MILADFYEELEERSETGQSPVPSVQDFVVQDGNLYRSNRAHENSQGIVYDSSESTALSELASAVREPDSSRASKKRILVSRIKGMFGQSK